ncbi:putative Ig domain-containing protein [Phyllobacterium leguminum]|uniref:putative Ig domain-containing protein n=1 Tax=Phyllobacterium leguminum TaxID=314237 RepID=UPI003CCB4013
MQPELTASGGTAPYLYVLSGNLSPELTFNGSTGILSGIPPVATTFKFTIIATDATGATRRIAPVGRYVKFTLQAGYNV